MELKNQDEGKNPNTKKARRLAYLLLGIGILLAFIAYCLVLLVYSEAYKSNGRGDVNSTYIVIGIFSLFVGLVIFALGIVNLLRSKKKQTSITYEGNYSTDPKSEIIHKDTSGSLNTLGVISFIVTILSPFVMFLFFFLFLLFPVNIYLILTKKVSGTPRVLTFIALGIDLLLIIFGLTFNFSYN